MFRIRKETRVPGTIVGHQFVGDPDLARLLFTKLSIENKLRIEVTAFQKGLVPKRDVADGIVFPNRLRAMGACNWNVRARGAFCRLLSRAILEHVVELAVGIDLLFRACGCEAGAAHVATTEPARVITDLVCESAFVTRFGQTLTVFNRSPSPASCECNKMWCPT